MDAFVLLGVVGTLASAGFLQLSNVLARAANSPHDAGLYAAALSLATPASLLSRSFSLVLFPSMSEAHGRDDQASLRAQTDLGTRALVLVMVGAFGVDRAPEPAAAAAALQRRSSEAAGVVLPIMLVAVLLGTVDEAGGQLPDQHQPARDAVHGRRQRGRPARGCASLGWSWCRATA